MAFGDSLRAKLQDIGAKFRDDEGLFQGGEFGRLGGRFRDFTDSTRTTMGGPDSVGGSTLSGLAGAAPGQDMMMGDPRATTGFADARSLATTFDPSSHNQVRELQLRLIDQGYLPEGADDSMFGPQTEAALRKMQGHFDMNDPNNPQSLLDFSMDSIPAQSPDPVPDPNLSTGQNSLNSAMSIMSMVPGLGTPAQPSYLQPNMQTNMPDPLAQFKLDYPDVAKRLAAQGNKVFR